jgi:hypothetical protein
MSHGKYNKMTVIAVLTYLSAAHRLYYSDIMPLDLTVLRETEVWWRDHQKWFEDSGYMLRPRYRPDWKPSWLENSNRLTFLCEDAQPLVVCSRFAFLSRTFDIFVI